MTIILTPASGGGGRDSRTPPYGGSGLSGAPQQVRVLVVEDEWLVSMEIEATLENAGYGVAGVAVSADEAVRMAEFHRPDLILMDIRLKGRRDGVDAALEIKERLGLRCVFVSAHNDEGMGERGQAADPLGWVSKPFSPRQLVDALEAALRDRPN